MPLWVGAWWRPGLLAVVAMSLLPQLLITSWPKEMQGVQCHPTTRGGCICPVGTEKDGQRCKLIPAIQPPERGRESCSKELQHEVRRRGGLSYKNATFSESEALLSCSRSCRPRNPVNQTCLQSDDHRVPLDSMPALPRICMAEHLADVFQSNRDTVETAWRRGFVKANRMKLLVAGLIRDGATSLPIILPLIDSLGKYFADYRIEILENDSTDNTTDVLEAMKLELPKLEYQSLFLNTSGDRDGTKNGLMWIRVKRMAQARNLLLQQLQSVMADFEPNLVLMVDLDLGSDSAYPFEPDMILASLGRAELENGFDLVCANSLRRYGQIHEVGYHDIFALRDQDHLTMDEFWAVDFNNPHALARNLFKQHDLIPVRSCFGGLAMYNPKAFCGCDYDETLNDCEHVGFHRCMTCRNMNRMFVDPLLATRYESEKVIPRICLEPGEQIQQREPPQTKRDCLDQGGHNFVQCGGTTYCCNHLACRDSHKDPIVCEGAFLQGCVCRNSTKPVSKPVNSSTKLT